ncbi:MAG: hypothetical protein E6K65_00860 [Nitrospirae bacterium]|nr:MAG: hypothetical protein E6K65_00860 [Nitrospirota bacterium]
MLGLSTTPVEGLNHSFRLFNERTGRLDILYIRPVQTVVGLNPSAVEIGELRAHSDDFSVTTVAEPILHLTMSSGALADAKTHIPQNFNGNVVCEIPADP